MGFNGWGAGAHGFVDTLGHFVHGERPADADGRVALQDDPEVVEAGGPALRVLKPHACGAAYPATAISTRGSPPALSLPPRACRAIKHESTSTRGLSTLLMLKGHQRLIVPNLEAVPVRRAVLYHARRCTNIPSAALRTSRGEGGGSARRAVSRHTGAARHARGPHPHTLATSGHAARTGHQEARTF